MIPFSCSLEIARLEAQSYETTSCRSDAEGVELHGNNLASVGDYRSAQLFDALQTLDLVCDSKEGLDEDSFAVNPRLS